MRHALGSNPADSPANGSDVIAEFTWFSGPRRPGGMREPHAPNIAPAFHWLPVVTMVQRALDMLNALEGPCCGHRCIAPDRIDTRAVAVRSEGWTAARAATREAILDAHATPF